MHQVGHCLSLYYDARSTKHKNLRGQDYRIPTDWFKEWREKHSNKFNNTVPRLNLIIHGSRATSYDYGLSCN